jgi:hypothetical protein
MHAAILSPIFRGLCCRYTASCSVEITLMYRRDIKHSSHHDTRIIYESPGHTRIVRRKSTPGAARTFLPPSPLAALLTNLLFNPFFNLHFFGGAVSTLAAPGAALIL